MHPTIVFTQGHRGTEMERLNFISGEIVNAAVTIHSELGPGLLESVYGVLLFHDLIRSGFTVEKQKWITFRHRGIRFKKGFRIDLLVRIQSLSSSNRARHSLVFMRNNS